MKVGKEWNTVYSFRKKKHAVCVEIHNCGNG